jgi:diadenylate cyclase
MIILKPVLIDADITGELLINIFIPNTPLHDGAVIIRNNRIAVAAAYLPLSDNSMIPKKRLGTRHRAAVGYFRSY